MSRFFYLLNRKHGPLSRYTEAQIRDSRRAMLKATLAASAGLLLSNSLTFGRDRRAGKSIVVVGAGFAGLACAHELLAAGYDVTVVDARNRVGGRVLTFSDMIPGKVIEGGAELIGSNHPHWLLYAEKFGLAMNDVGEDDVEFVLGGKAIRGEEAAKLWEGLEAGFNTMNDLAAPVNAERPWESPDAAALDKRTVRSWIESSGLDKNVQAAIDANLAGDNGVPTGRLSLLAMLSQVKGGGLDRFWSDSEVYRCKGGNQQLATHLAEAIGKNRIELDLRVREIDTSRAKPVVSCADGRTIECDDVVLAVPPSVWSKIKMSPALPDTLKPQMGGNTKYLTVTKKRFWKDAERPQYTLSDGDIAWTWESTDAQGDTGNMGFTGFCGGPASDRWRAKEKEAREKGFSDLLENWYPGFKENFVSSRFMDWPADPLALASYSAFGLGEITRAGPTLHKGVGKLHFAGEHCSFAFMGYMEGALHSGVSLARRIATRDGLTGPAPVDLPQPSPKEEPVPAGDPMK